VLNESLSNIFGGVSVGKAGSPSVCVNEEDVERAAVFVEKFKRKVEERGGGHDAVTGGGPWKCANCGEVIEEQFTDCWNCQTARPVDEGAEAPVEDLSLNSDVACIGCEYNLRGLTATARCPECGLPAMRSLLSIMSAGAAMDVDAYRFVRGPFEKAERAIGYPAGALILVCRAWMYTMAPTEPSEGEATVPRDLAAKVCAAIRDYSLDYFGIAEEARAGLEKWGIGGSEDIARILEGLMRAGIIEAVEGDWVKGFHGLYTLEGILAGPEIWFKDSTV
jgi:uncharacterized repeat protein (TIGR04138 family)